MNHVVNTDEVTYKVEVCMHRHHRTQFSEYIQLVNKLNWSQIFRLVYNKIIEEHKINAGQQSLNYTTFMNKPAHVCYTIQHISYTIYDFPTYSYQMDMYRLQDFRITVL